MAEVATLAQGIYQIKPPTTVKVLCSNVFLVAADRPAIVETGPGVMADHALAALGQLGYDLASIAYVIPTHLHVDHAGGIGYAMQKLPNAQLVVHHRGASHAIDPSRLIASSKGVFGDNYQDFFGPILPVPEDRIWAVKGGEEVDLGNRKLSIIDTPGHAPHHMSIVDSLTRAVFCGEAMGGFQSDSEFVLPAIAPPSFVQEDYLESVRKIVALDPSIVIASHNGSHDRVAQMGRSVEQSLNELGEVILAALREGAEKKEIERRVQEVYSRYGRPARSAGAESGGGTGMTVDAFVVYFKRKGLV